MKLSALQYRADTHELPAAKGGTPKLIWAGAVALPGETERSSLAHPGGRWLYTSPTAASSPYRKAAGKGPGSSAVQGNMVRSSKHELKWDNQTRYQRIILFMRRVGTGTGCPERLSNPCPWMFFRSDCAKPLGILSCLNYPITLFEPEQSYLVVKFY